MGKLPFWKTKSKRLKLRRHINWSLSSLRIITAKITFREGSKRMNNKRRICNRPKWKDSHTNLKRKEMKSKSFMAKWRKEEKKMKLSSLISLAKKQNWETNWNKMTTRTESEFKNWLSIMKNKSKNWEQTQQINRQV